MPFGMMSGVGRGMGVVIVEWEGLVFGVNLGHPIVTSGDFATRLFPNYFGQDLYCKQIEQITRQRQCSNTA